MHIILDKADPVGQGKVQDTIIEIKNKLPKIDSLEMAERHYEEQATLLEKALQESICQGVKDRLLIKLMARKVSLYRGITN
ncbi:MAG: hypothetical protein ABIG69_14065 [Bacteroidota bacterium]